MISIAISVHVRRFALATMMMVGGTLASSIALADNYQVFNVSGTFASGTILSGTLTIDTSQLVTQSDGSQSPYFVSAYLQAGNSGALRCLYQGPETVYNQSTTIEVWEVTVGGCFGDQMVHLFLPTENLVNYNGGDITPEPGTGTYSEYVQSVNNVLVYDYLVSGSLSLAPVTSSLSILSPFLLGASDLSNLNLPTLVPNLPSLASATATGLSADGVSAAIALFSTNYPYDVTFSTNNGTTLAAFNPNFLEESPYSGSTTLTVPARNLIGIGSLLYAAALVQAPCVGQAPSYSTPVIVTAQQQGGQPFQANMTLVPPPVIFVPGLWNVDTSLVPMADYLSSVYPWNAKTTDVSVAHYDGSKPFDSGLGAMAIDTLYNKSIADMDSHQIVGGRVDVVAHSMGGLVVRNYTTRPGYSSLRNRGGKIFEVISLDTPEYGSGLASWLLKNKDRKFDENAHYVSKKIWKGASCRVKDSLAQCFNRLNDPVEKGAVASLIPGNSSLAAAPYPASLWSIIWLSVSAIRPNEGRIGESTEQFELERLISATYDSTVMAPTITSVLQDSGQDDAIVPVFSQLIGTSGAYVTLPNLSHNPVKPLPLHFLTQTNPANVQTDPTVEALVSCWLQTAGSASCAQAANKAAPHSTLEIRDDDDRLRLQRELNKEDEEERKHPEIDDSLAVEPFEAKLAVPVDIVVHVRNISGIREIAIVQEDSQGHRSDSSAKAVWQEPGTATITVVPTILRKVHFSFNVEFNDGGSAVQNIWEFVGLPNDRPLQLYTDVNAEEHLDRGKYGRVPKAKLYISLGMGGRYQLQSEAVFENMPSDPIDLKGLLHYEVIPGGDPCIIIDKLGWISALQPGEATVETHLGTATDRLRVVVSP